MMADAEFGDCYHSADKAGARVEVTLKKAAKVQKVQLLRQSNRPPAQLKDLLLEVCADDGSCVPCGKSGKMVRERGKGKYSEQGCGYNPRPVGSKVVITAPAGLAPDGYLILCEVRVKGEWATTTTTTTTTTTSTTTTTTTSPTTSTTTTTTPTTTTSTTSPTTSSTTTTTTSPTTSSTTTPTTTTTTTTVSTKPTPTPVEVQAVSCGQFKARLDNTCEKLYDKRMNDANMGPTYEGPDNPCYHSEGFDPPDYVWIELGVSKTLTEVRTLSRSDATNEHRSLLQFWVCPSGTSADGCQFCGRRTNIEQGKWVNTACDAGATGRFLRIVPEENMLINICEVQIMGYENTPSVELAAVDCGQFKARLDNTCEKLSDKRMNDANMGPTYEGPDNPCYHSEGFDPPDYVWIELGETKTVTSVATLSRSDATNEHRSLLQFWLCPSGNSAEDCVFCGRRTNTEQGKWVTTYCDDGATGEFLRIVPEENMLINICEVQIFGYAETPSYEIDSVDCGQFKARLDNTCEKLSDKRMNDADMGPTYEGPDNPCYHSEGFYPQDYVWLDLGEYKTVTTIKTLSRSDATNEHRSLLQFWLCPSGTSSDGCTFCGRRTNIEQGKWVDTPCKSGAGGEFLRIVPEANMLINFCEIQVFGFSSTPPPPPPPSVELAPQSCETIGGAPVHAALGCNGLYDGTVDNPTHDTCYEAIDKNGFARVDLGSTKTVTSIDTLTREDATCTSAGFCAEYFKVTYSVCATAEFNDCTVCGYRTDTRVATWQTIQCENVATGRYLVVSHTAKTHPPISCEIKIFGYQPANTPVELIPQSCETIGGAPVHAALGCNGLYDGTVATPTHDTCYEAIDKSGYARVDLGSSKTVTSIDTLTREDATCTSAGFCAEYFKVTYSVCATADDSDCKVCGYRTDTNVATWQTIECEENATGRYLVVSHTAKTLPPISCEINIWGY